MILNNNDVIILNNVLDKEWVSLDLETTGLNPKEDKIIEIGAVKFDGKNILETFESFINPSCKLSDFTKMYTGINQSDVDQAPSFNLISDSLKKFIGNSPIVGHNIEFDINFLKFNGLILNNKKSDTWDLAYILFPQFFDYSLIGLSNKFKVGHDKPHRALDDAIATKGVFENLILELLKIDYNSFIKIKDLANKSNWILSYLMNNNNLIDLIKSKDSKVDENNLNFKNILDLFNEISNKDILKPSDNLIDLDMNSFNELLMSENIFSDVVKNFKKRPQQISMSLKIAESINKNKNLIGILSEKDCLRIFSEGSHNEMDFSHTFMLGSGTVEAFMSTSISSIDSTSVSFFIDSVTSIAVSVMEVSSVSVLSTS